MKQIKVTDARNSIYKIIDEVNETHEPYAIHGKRGNAVLMSEEDYRSIQETLYLLSIPNMRESIIEGLNTPLSETSDKIEW